MSKASTHAGYIIMITILLAIIVRQGTERDNLKSTASERCEEIELLEKQVDHLQTENNIFTSMLGEIENEPGGHEILKKLWNENK